MNEVVESVVVVVADGDGRCPAGAGQAGLGRDIGERAVAVVLVEAIGRTRRRPFETRAAQHEQIQPAVVVVVEKRHSASDDLDDVALSVDAAVDDRLRRVPPDFATSVKRAVNGRPDGLPRGAGLTPREDTPWRKAGSRRARQQGEHSSTGNHLALLPCRCGRLGRDQYLARLHVVERLHGSRRPANLDELGSGIGAKTDEQPLVARRQIADGGVDREVLGQAGGGHDFDAGCRSRRDSISCLTVRMPSQLPRLPPSFRST